jgi:hypothetical protein
MMRRWTVRISALVMALAPLAVVAAPAVGQNVEGTITKVDLRGEPRHILVRTSDGQEVQVRVHVSPTKIIFTDPRDANVSPELTNLKEGEQVRAQYNGDQPSSRIEVLSVPAAVRTALIQRNDPNADQRTAHEGEAAAREAAASKQLMVRILKTDQANRGRIRADVAGKPRDFRLDDTKVLASFREGDLVVVTVDDPNSSVPVIKDMRPSSDAGVPNTR